MQTAYLLSYHIDPGHDGLFLATSDDGLTWTQLGSGSFLRPSGGTGIMRDPCVCQGPDGMFHVAWTTGWYDTGIGLAHSRDLVNWSEATYLPVMAHEPKAVNAWAPEIFYDDATGEFVIHWASTILGRYPETDATGDEYGSERLNHRMYCVTTKDFVTFSPTRLFYDGGFSVIDATMIKGDDRYLLFVKDETLYPVAKKEIRVATASSALGPYGPASAPISPSWVEGPTVLKVGDEWIMYFDEYSRHVYGAMASIDLVTWRSVTDRLVIPAGAKHATALKVDKAIVDGFRNS